MKSSSTISQKVASMNDEELAQYLEKGQQEAIEEAQAKGFEVFIPDESTITLDLDTPKSEEVFEEMKGLVEKLLHIQYLREWRSKSGHRHVLLTSPKPLTPETRILLQACMGSDLKRELLSFNRFQAYGEQHPSILFKPVGEE